MAGGSPQAIKNETGLKRTMVFNEVEMLHSSDRCEACRYRCNYITARQHLISWQRFSEIAYYLENRRGLEDSKDQLSTFIMITKDAFLVRTQLSSSHDRVYVRGNTSDRWQV